tara:strand:+ start:2574 stop:2750 length:177 start_codon:yes stop_codon:yes gene_type:complete
MNKNIKLITSQEELMEILETENVSLRDVFDSGRLGDFRVDGKPSKENETFECNFIFNN